jgi:hypothetical protein
VAAHIAARSQSIVRRYAQYKGDAEAPWPVVWDGHEGDNNCADDVPENKDAGQLNDTTEHSGNSVAQAVLNALRHRGYLTIVVVAVRGPQPPLLRRQVQDMRQLHTRAYLRRMQPSPRSVRVERCPRASEWRRELGIYTPVESNAAATLIGFAATGARGIRGGLRSRSLSASTATWKHPLHRQSAKRSADT